MRRALRAGKLALPFLEDRTRTFRTCFRTGCVGMLPVHGSMFQQKYWHFRINGLGESAVWEPFAWFTLPRFGTRFPAPQLNRGYHHELRCPMDYHMLPFDSQECFVKMASYSWDIDNAAWTFESKGPNWMCVCVCVVNKKGHRNRNTRPERCGVRRFWDSEPLNMYGAKPELNFFLCGSTDSLGTWFWCDSPIELEGTVSSLCQ